MPAVAVGFRRARPALVPGQFAASGGSTGARTALDLAPSPSHRDRILSHRPALADVSAARDPDLVAGSICPAGIFSEGILAVSEMACPGSGSRGLGLRRHHGAADRAKAARLHSAADANR